MATQLDDQDALDAYTRDTDFFEALSYAMACSKSVHQQLHNLEELDPRAPAPWPDVCCARTLTETALMLSEILGGLVAMVDETRRAGRSWTDLPIQQKGESLRDVFQRAGPSAAADFEDISTVWWEPFDLYGGQLTPPVGGCPALTALNERADSVS
ncbi:MAG TPA: hypothetical protein DCK98_18365 [Chloroflexi bacterium]|jgi:hypothetical protein|nr:hypothetical protein [Chloroflexota bacterium]HAL27470.1 hypothetical protein [Chloroflexota bacterium]